MEPRKPLHRVLGHSHTKAAGGGPPRNPTSLLRIPPLLTTGN